MAKKDDKPKGLSKTVKTGLDNLKNITAVSKRDANSSLEYSKSNLDSTMYDINNTMIELDPKRLMSNKISSSRMTRISQNAKMREDDLYDIIKDKDMLTSVESMSASLENTSFTQMTRDYEIVKRAIPQVHKTIMSMVNNIANPDSISSDIIGLKFPSGISEETQDEMKACLKKAEVNKDVKRMIFDYLVLSVCYISNVPYTRIIDMLRYNSDVDGTLVESSNPNDMITNLDILTEGKIFMLNDDFSAYDNLTESVNDVSDSDTIDDDEFDRIINAYADSIMCETEIIDGALAYHKNDILNKIVSEELVESTGDASMNDILKNFEKGRNQYTGRTGTRDVDNVPEGFKSDKELDKIQKNVNLKGCFTEYLDPAKVAKLDIRGTEVCYMYAEEVIDISGTGGSRSAGFNNVVDQINSTVYKKSGRTAGDVKDAMVRRIGDKIIDKLSDKFLSNNSKDLEVIYQFVRDNQLYRDRKRIVFFKPDEIIEAKREDGSILKNSMFMAKLLILTIMSNTFFNATRGGDRTHYYVSTGFSTDIEGHVNNAIYNIKRGQLRHSDIGSVAEVFNVVGRNVDVFIPQTIDNIRPIDAEVISGQDIDMNEDFIQYMTRSIVLSIGLPSVTIDEQDTMDLAKSLAMSNLDAAQVFMNEQIALEEPVTKHVRDILRYNFPDIQNVDLITASFNYPTVIIREMNREIISSVTEMADMIADLLIGEENESVFDMRKRILRYRYIRKSTPTLDWDTIDEILDDIGVDYKIGSLNSKLVAITNKTEDDMM